MRTVLIAAMLAAVPVSALADWQNTSWTMSRTQVAAATGARLVQGNPGDRVFNADLGAEGTYTALGFDFTSKFFFDAADRLRGVKLTLVDQSRCDELQRTMDSIYGRPLDVSLSISKRWIDAGSGDSVRFTDLDGDIGGDCFLAYSPTLTQGARGL